MQKLAVLICEVLLAGCLAYFAWVKLQSGLTDSETKAFYVVFGILPLAATWFLLVSSKKLFSAVRARRRPDIWVEKP